MIRLKISIFAICRILWLSFIVFSNEAWRNVGSAPNHFKGKMQLVDAPIVGISEDSWVNQPTSSVIN